MSSGTIKFAKVDSGTRYLQMGAQGVHVLNDVIIDTNHNIPWASYFEAASLDIQDGELNSYGGSDGIIITGDLTVGNGTDNASLTYTSDSNGFHDQKFGSVTINSNGTLQASNQTTTITDVYSSPFALNNSGTFTHNAGTLVLNRAGNQDFVGTWTGSSALYNLTVNCGGGTQSIRANMEIEGGLIITNGNFSTHSDSHDLTVSDLITVNGGTFTTNSSTINCGGIRNVGGTIA